MDLSKTISYNSLTVNGSLAPVAGGAGMSGYAVEQVDVTPVDVTQRLDKRALQDGLDAQDVFLGGRHITAIIAVFGSTHGDFWDKAQDLLAAFSPTLAYAADSANLGYLALDFYQPTADIVTWPTSAYPSGIPLRYYCRPMSPPSYVMRRDEQGGAAALGLAKRFSLSLLARDPRKYVQTAETATIGTSTTTQTNLGDYPTPATFTITAGAFTGAMAFTVAGNAFTINVDSTTATYTIDTVAGTIRKSGVLNMSLLTAGSLRFDLPVGASTAVRGSVVGATVSMTYRHAFT